MTANLNVEIQKLNYNVSVDIDIKDHYTFEMIKIRTKIPDHSILKKDEKLFQYIDCFVVQSESCKYDLNATEIGKLFLISGPKWADKLMLVRDKVIGIFGLKTTQQMLLAERNSKAFGFEPGEQLGIFKLYAKTENELVLGEDDKHLNFRVSLLTEAKSDDNNKKEITITTAVQYRNLFGRIYFIPVRPIHKLIVKGTLKEMIRKIECLNSN